VVGSRAWLRDCTKVPHVAESSLVQRSSGAAEAPSSNLIDTAVD